MDTTKMLEQLKAAGNKILTAIKGVSKKVWIIIGVLVVLAAAAITFYLNTRPYSILVTGVSAQEGASVMTWLEGQGVRDYKWETDTNTILVPDRMAASLKASLLNEKYSTGSSGFSGYFDNVSALSTEKERNTAFTIALKEEIENVARAFPGVMDATVEIAEGEDLNYILDSNNVELGSVSILLTMAGNQMLTTEQATALRNFVAYGVKGMSVDRVSIGDTNGNTYSNLVSGTQPGGVSAVNASQLKLQYQEYYNNMMNMSVRRLLDNVFGSNNYTVVANSIVDVDVQEIEEHQIIMPEESWWNESGGAGIIGSRAGGYTFKSTPEAVASGVVGTTTNSDNDIPTYVELGPDGSAIVGIIEGDYQIDYEHSTKDIRTYASSCRLEDASVAVIINATTANANGQTVDVVALRNSLAAAVGITPVVTETMTAEEYLASKISVQVLPFYAPPEEGPNGGENPDIIQPWIIYAAIAGLVLFVILLIVLLVLSRRRKKKKKQQEEQAAEQEKQQAMQLLVAAGVAGAAGENGEPMGADVMSLQSEKSMELRQSIRKFAEENPEIAAQMVKNWLRGGEESA